MINDIKSSASNSRLRDVDNIEYWPITSHTTQRQIEEWSLDEDNSALYKQSEAERLEFLEFKYNHLGWNESKYYFEKLGVPIAGKIVEQGAGCFWLSSYLSSFDEVEEIIGVELSENRILAFRDIALSLFLGVKKNKIKYVVGDMHELNIPDNSVDLVVCDAVLHHADNLVAVLRECHRVLKSGGWFVALREPSISKFRIKDPQFHSRYPEDGTAQYYYRDGWKSAFLNGWFKNIKMCNFMEYGYVKGLKTPWLIRKILRIVDFRIPINFYPKICIAAQKP